MLRQRDTIQSARGHSLIKVKEGGPTLTFLPKAVQQLKMLPRQPGHKMSYLAP